MTRRSASGPLRANPANPRYFADATGKAVYLTGSHTWNNVVDMGKSDPPPALDFARYVDFLEGHNHNFTRLWTWDMLCTWNAEERVAPFPWARTGPGGAADGKPRFDLTRFDDEYFGRLRTRLQMLQDRGIYASVMLFEGWAVFTGNRTRLDWHVFAGLNNVNGVNILSSESGGVLREWITLDNPAVVALQEDYVRKLIQTVNGFDNVLYEICNEAGGQSHGWQEHFVRFIHDAEAGMPKQHPVGTTGGMGTLNERSFASSADWVAPEGWAPEGRRHGYREGGHAWGEAPFERGDKVVLLDTDHIWGIGGDAPWAWKTFCQGYNVLYMDRCDGYPWAFYEHEWWPQKADPVLRREMGKARAYAERMDLNAAVPHGELSSTGYCLADPGHGYLIYQPAHGAFTVRLEAGRYTCEWHDPESGRAQGGGRFRAQAGEREFPPPFQGSAVLFIAGTH